MPFGISVTDALAFITYTCVYSNQLIYVKDLLSVLVRSFVLKFARPHSSARCVYVHLRDPLEVLAWMPPRLLWITRGIHTNAGRLGHPDFFHLSIKQLSELLSQMAVKIRH